MTRRNYRATSLLLLAVALLALRAVPAAADEVSDSEKRLLESVSYLASDELEGRGVTTKGINAAADYIAEQFAKAGLKTELYDGTAFQTFNMITGAKLGEQNSAVLVGPDGKQTALKFKRDFTPMGIGAAGKLEVPLVFGGYSITAKNLKYDDYGDVDVKGKAVIVIRKEPQQGNPHSVFDGTRNSLHAPFERKISNAYQNGAAAVVLVNDHFSIARRVAQLGKARTEAGEKLAALEKEAGDEPSEQQAEQLKRLRAQVARLQQQLDEAEDPMMQFLTAGLENNGRDIPVISVRRAALDPLLKAALGKDLAQLEKEIDEGPTPQSRELEGWKIDLDVNLERTRTGVKNVLGVLPGAGPLAEETVVIGAHYDHLGYGGQGSLAPQKRGEIHNGADDNGSGTATLIEVAHRLAGKYAALGDVPRRRVLFIAFTAEERGLIGSAHYAGKPLFAMDKTVAMLNMDMVGRLNDNKLIVQGTDTAKGFGAMIDKLNETYGFKITKRKGGTGPSDHTSFYVNGVPAIHFFTGTHKDYHRPSDDADKLNIPGMRRIGEMVGDAALEIALAEKQPEYVKLAARQPRGGGGDRPYLGSIPDFSGEVEGYKLQGVTAGGPAEKAGIKGGDVIIQFDKYKIGGLEDIDGALRKFKGGDKVKVIVLRGDKKLTLEVILGDPR